MNNNELKYIQSFAHKKQWDQESVFIVEGPKLLEEVMKSDWVIEKIYATQEWLDVQSIFDAPHELIDSILLGRISHLQQPNQVLALVHKKKYNSPLVLNDQFTLMLDGIQDPGNVGTIIRTADWFGIPQIIVSPDTAQLYNPKVLQSTMGSFLRVRVQTQNLEEVLASTKLPVYGALLNGENVFQSKMQKEGILVIGNESKGIRPNILPYIKHPITIPNFGQAESLNAAVATGIILGSLIKSNG